MTIRSFTDTKPFNITLLRKELSKYDIARPNSITSLNIMKSAHLSNIFRANRRSNNVAGRDHQLNVGCMIAIHRGFSQNLWNNLLKNVSSSLKKRTKSKFNKDIKKRYSGGFRFDSRSKSHLILKDLFSNCSLPTNYNKPISLPSKSMFQYYYTNKSFLRSMRNHVTLNHI